MATKLKDTSITQMFSSIAAAQTMVEQFPFSVETTGKGFTCSFDLLATLFEVIAGEPLANKIVDAISEKLSDPNDKWLQNIEETVKLVLEANVTNLFTCQMAPIIPNNLIGAYQFAPLTNISLPQNGEGIRIPISDLDFTGILGNCPADDEQSSVYIDNGKQLGVKDLWKHVDFNAFLWYVKNKGVYGNLTERNKLIWDNRYKSKPYEKYVPKDETFFTQVYPDAPQKNGKVPFDNKYLKEYNEKNEYKKRQILECQYVEADGLNSDSIIFRLPASNYYRTRKLKKKGNDNPVIWEMNKTIFEFNHHFLMSLKLYDAKAFLNQLVHNTFGTGNFSFNFSLTRENEQMDEIINGLIDKVIQSDDLQINDDCYYSFSNDEYNVMMENMRQRKIAGENNAQKINDLAYQIKTMDYNNASADAVAKTTFNVLSTIANSMADEAEVLKTGGNWKFEYDYQFELIRMLVYPLIKPLFTPKVMTLILINNHIMGNPLEIGNKILTWEDLQPYVINLLRNIIVTVKNMIVEMVYGWVLEKLIKILTLFSLKLYIEQINNYKILIEDLLNSILSASKKLQQLFQNKNGAIGNVDYVDIEQKEMDENVKDTPSTNSKC